MKYGVILKIYNTIEEYFNQMPASCFQFESELTAKKVGNDADCFTYDIEIV